MNYTYSYNQPAKTLRRRRIITVLYLILFGVMIGVVLMIAAGPGRQADRNQGGVRESAPSATGSMSAGPTSGSGGTSTAALGVGGDVDYRDIESAVIEATQKAMPAVVTVHVTGTVLYRSRDPFFDFYYGPVRRQNVAGIGSGVIIDPDGMIITNDHVVHPQSVSRIRGINVELPDGRTFEADLTYSLPQQDIAILQVDGESLPYLPFGASESVQQGQTVLAIGNPFGNVLTGGLLGSEPTVTRGIISARQRNITVPSGQVTRYYRNMLQTDASINKGNSGGALIDLEGNLIGMNTVIYTPNADEGSVGIGFAIPSDRLRLILDQIKQEGGIGRAYSGVAVQNLTGEIAEAIDYPEGTGVVVSSVQSGSPGEESGLRRGDIIVKVNGFTVTSADDVVNLFQGSVPGETFMLTVFRDGDMIDLEIRIGSRE